MSRARQRDNSAILFVRVGWMTFYKGSIPGDEKPLEGGRYNKDKVGHEVYNFSPYEGRLYGYFQPPTAGGRYAVNPKRIVADAAPEDILEGVLIVFVAPKPRGPQVLVGWYDRATLLPQIDRAAPGKPRGFGYICDAAVDDCVLLPHAARNFEIPRAGGLGQANVCYPLDEKGRSKDLAWMGEARAFIAAYRGPNLLVDPSADIESLSAAAAMAANERAKGQGFNGSAEDRKALEEHAMAAATRHFKDLGYSVKNVSASKPYDLHCTKKNISLCVEVKGTTTAGDTVIITKNEAEHATDPLNECALFVLHSIELIEGRTDGGIAHIVSPWRPHEDDLSVISYICRVP